MKDKQFVPITPGGTPLVELASDTEAGAWAALIEDVPFLLHKTKEEVEKRGYCVDQFFLTKRNPS